MVSSSKRPDIIDTIISTTTPSITISTPLSMQPSFSLQDINFFHHFLTTAFPYLPKCEDYIWTNVVPLYAEQSGYLMHAMMALGASHLGALSGIDYAQASQLHRSAAISGLQRAINGELDTAIDYDVALACCYVLSFQTAYVADAFADFIAMSRGCHLLAMKIKEQGLSSVFSRLPHCEKPDTLLQAHKSAPQNVLLLQKGTQALQTYEPRLRTLTQINVFKLLNSVLEQLQESPEAGCLQFYKLYQHWYELDHQEFAEFVDARDAVSQVLMTYLIATQVLMYPFAAIGWPDRARHSRLHLFMGTSLWAHQVGSRIQDVELQRHLEWPREAVAAMQWYNVWNPDGDVVTV